MIHIFNRRELITVHLDQQCYRIQNALDAAGIPYQTSLTSPYAASRYRGTPGIKHDATHPCTIYVKTSDYNQALATIQMTL